MTNQAPNSAAIRAPLKPTKKQVLQLHKQQQQQQLTNEPWLFQSVSLLQNRSSPTTPPAPALLALSPTSPQFYLDVESLRTLLPASSHRHRPRSSQDSDRGREEFLLLLPYRSPPSKSQYPLHPPARLDALVLPSTQQQHHHHQNQNQSVRKRKHRAKSARPTSVHRKVALRIDAIKARRHANANATHSIVNKHKTTRSSVIANAQEDEQDEEPQDLVLPEDLDEERRQTAAIAAQLGLTLDEYDALDSAFGGGGGGDTDTEDGSRTERYRAVFAQYDVDGSGAISPEELRQLLVAAGEDMDDAELGQVIAQADTDGDGEIDFAEFIGLMKARKRLLLVAKTMGVSGTGPGSRHTSSRHTSSHPSSLSAKASPLPPLKLVVAQSKRHLVQTQFTRHFSRPTPHCLRPGASVDVTQLRRELALAEYGVQQLNDKVRDGVAWVQAHCPVNSLKAQLFCHRWGMEKVHALLRRLQSQALSRAYQKWKAFLVYERNKVKANLFLKCKGSQKMTEIMAKWKRKTLRRRFAKWKSESAADARNELLATVLELQRVWRGALARRWRARHVTDLAATSIQSLVRGHLARCLGKHLRHARLEHESACILQRCYRGYSGKRLAKALFKAQQDALAARRIQRAFRNHQRRVLLRAIQRTKLEYDAAVHLQCCMRSFLARKERRQRALARQRIRSSIRIQRLTRGFLARRQVHHKRRKLAAAITIQTKYRAFRSRWQFLEMRRAKADREQRARERAAAVAIQTSWRRTNARTKYLAKKTQLQEARTLLAVQRLTSAVRIQRLFRGYRARRRAQKLRYDKLKWLNYTAMNASALRIQATWRGYHGRLASQLRMQAKRALEAEETLAARTIQSVARSKLARAELERRESQRRHVMGMQHKRTRAALQIQRVFRGKRARRVAARLRREHEEQAHAALDRLVKQTKARAAIKMQCCARRYLARHRYLVKKRAAERRKLEHARKLQQEHAVIVIQCAVRRGKARRLLLARRREFEKRISMMASEKAQDEIERLRQEQEQELARLRVQLMLQENKASEQTTKLREELERQRELENERREQEAQELAKLKLEALMQQHAQQSDRKILEFQKQQESENLREQIERQLLVTKEMEEMVRTQENEALARLKMTALLQTTTITTVAEKAREEEQTRLELEAAQLQKAALAMHREQARLKIQSVCLKYIAKRRLFKLQAEQAAALAQLQNEEERQRMKALQEKELTLAKLKATMDDEARAREQELKAMEAEMLERARLEKERIAKRVAAARKIQARVRGYLGRQRVKAIQCKIEKEREERTKAMEEQLAAAEAKMAEALTDGDVAGTGDSTSSPEDWVEYWDENAQASYFYNIKTQEASWTRPFSAAAAAKAVNLLAGSSTPAVDYDAAAYAEGYTENGSDANSGRAYGAAGYADEYGFYDQYGQYHYYDDGSGNANANTYQAANNAAMAAGMMYPGYAAAAAAYAYQAAMAFGGNATMYGAGMPFNQQMMMPSVAAPLAVNPMMMTVNNAAVAQPTATEDETTAPPDPWEKFFDQYSGAAYYYNSITGEKYWA